MSTTQRVFLTGASAGIGLATARALSDIGCEVWGTSRRLDRLPVNLRNFHPIELSLSEPDSICAAWSRARSESGGFDIVINNAGDGWFDALTELPLERMRAQFETLFFGPFQIIQLALPDLRERRGLLVNVTSLAVRLPIPFMAPYSAAKAALASATAALRLELAASGVRIVDLQPGNIRTNFNEAMKPPAAGSMREAWDQMEQDMAAAPGPEIVGAEVCRLVRSTDSPPSRVVGGFVESRLASLAARCLPARWMERMLLRHYRQPGS